MTVLDSRPGPPFGPESRGPIDVLSPGSGRTMSTVEDLGAGRGPSWLDKWLGKNLGQVVAWRRQIHANPELSRNEHNTTKFLFRELANAGLRPRVLPGGTGLIARSAAARAASRCAPTSTRCR